MENNDKNHVCFPKDEYAEWGWGDIFNDIRKNEINADFTFIVGCDEKQRAFRVHRFILKFRLGLIDKSLDNTYDLPNVDPDIFEIFLDVSMA